MNHETPFVSSRMVARTVLFGVSASIFASLLPWSFCMEGDAHGFPFPVVHPRHGEESMLLGWVTGTKGGGVVVDLSAIPMNACIFVAAAAVVALGYRVIKRDASSLPPSADAR